MDLTAAQARVVGCLIEKAETTPDSYPLTTNALRSACNQSTNRDPVVDYSEREVDAVMLELREMKLARTVTGSGHRVGKHKHVVDEALGLEGHELAVLASLLLRGPQTRNEIAARTERYATGPQGDRDAVDSAIDRLAARPEPLVVRLARRSGEREPRIDQRWTGSHDGEPPAVAPAPTFAAEAPTATPDTSLEARVIALETELARQTRRLDALFADLSPDPLRDSSEYGPEVITTLEVNRSDHSLTRVVDTAADITEGQVLARIDHFSLTSNNVTYAVIGHTLGYWDFFPPAGEGWGRVPAFGYAEIVESRCEGVDVGTRVYGYLPMSSHVVLEPGRINPHSFHDIAAHRQPMSEVYNRYAIATLDPLHDSEREGQRMLLHPLFMTSFVIDDFFLDNADFGAISAVISSASSKTAIGVAHLMAKRGGLHVIGLTSPGNLAFTESLGCHDQLVTYDRIAELDPRPAVYIDIAGSGSVRHAVHTHFGDDLKFSSAVGATAWDDLGGAGTAPLPGPSPEFFFAPSQLQKRTEDWGREEMERRVLEAWTGFSAWTDGWMRIVEHEGAPALAEVWAEMLSGRVDPALGHIVHIAGGAA